MEEKKVQALIDYANSVMRMSITLITLGFFVTVLLAVNPNVFKFEENIEPMNSVGNVEYGDRIEDGIHLRTGLIDAEGMHVVIANCTNCHSAKLVTQNRMTKERWNETITWMQETQSLWDLGENQEIIVNYLVKNYPTNNSFKRRTNLTNIDWYEMDN